jgi:hypothetical protein
MALVGLLDVTLVAMILAVRSKRTLTKALVAAMWAVSGVFAVGL